MRADIDGAVALVRAASAFGWTWTSEDFADFCQEVGWERVADAGTARTNLNIDSPFAWARLHQGLLDDWGGVGEDLLEIAAKVTDATDPDDQQMRPAVAQMFTSMNEALMVELGPPTSLYMDGEEWQESYWEFAAVVICLSWRSGNLTLRFTNPRYQQLSDYVDSLEVHDD